MSAFAWAGTVLMLGTPLTCMAVILARAWLRRRRARQAPGGLPHVGRWPATERPVDSFAAARLRAASERRKPLPPRWEPFPGEGVEPQRRKDAKGS